jgi:hypothetical protein
MHFADRAHVYGRLDLTIFPHVTYLKLNAGDLRPDLKWLSPSRNTWPAGTPLPNIFGRPNSSARPCGQA